MPPKAAQLVLGDARQISDLLITSDEIRKVSFSGSTWHNAATPNLDGGHISHTQMVSFARLGSPGVDADLL